MANKKKKKANRPRAVAIPASEKLAQDRAEFEALEEEESTPVLSKEEKSSTKSKDKDKDKGKGKDKKVIKSQARAKDPKKTNKKPNLFRRFVEYLKQVRLEIKRTTWPTKNEVLNMAIIVLVALLFFGILIFIIDFIMVQLLNLYGHLLPQAGTDAAAAAASSTSSTDSTTTDTTAIRLLGHLDFSNLLSFIGGE